jgi:hypothetical protein
MRLGRNVNNTPRPNKRAYILQENLHNTARPAQ